MLWEIVLDCFSKIQYELEHAVDKYSKNLIVSNIEMFLDYCIRFYARELNLSGGYFGDLIKKETGKTAQEYIQWKVIDVAKERIFHEAKSISQIAYDLSFKYPQHFIRVFKQHVGSTPSEYRTLN